MRARLTRRPLVDASVVTALLLATVWLGSRGGRDLDPALFGYAARDGRRGLRRDVAGECLLAAPGFGRLWTRAARSARRPRRFFADAPLGGHATSRRRRSSHAAPVSAGLAHMALSLGTLASFAITIPLVFGWLHFEADGQSHYRPMLFGFPAGPALAIDGIPAWFVFHGLALAGARGDARDRLLPRRSPPDAQRIPGVTSGRHVAPLVLLLVVALSGLALPASRTSPVAFAIASRVHELAVIVLLVALPFSKLAHVLIRPAAARRPRHAERPDAERRLCACGAIAGTRGAARRGRSVARRAAARASPGTSGTVRTCRRRLVAAAQAHLLGAPFHPDLVAASPERPNRKVA